MLRKTAFSILLLLWTAVAFGEQVSGAARSVTFTLDWPVQTPPRYSISVDSGGTALYTDSSDDSPYSLQWTISEPLKTQIFDLMQQLGSAPGNIESKAKVANTGMKTLVFKDGAHSTSVSYNYSELPPVEKLTRIFQSIATTVRLGKKIEHDARFDRLGLDAALKTLQEQQKNGNALEIEAVRPLLQKIANNRSLMNLAQQRAAQILKAAGLPVAPEAPQNGG